MISEEILNAWKSAKPASNEGFKTLPSGTYEAVLERASLDDEKNFNGKIIPPSLSYFLRIVGGEYDGVRVRKQTNINGAQSLGYIKKDMLTLGCKEVDSLLSAPLAINQAIGKVLEIRVKKTTYQDKEYTNIYFNRVINKSPVDSREIDEIFNVDGYENAPF